MHILMTADTVGGVWTYARELVTGLASRGHTVTLVSFGKRATPEQVSWMKGLRNVDYRETEYRLEWMQGSAEDIEKSTIFLIELIRQVHPDVLHLNQFAYGALATDLPKIVVAHSDVISWWSNVHDEGPPDTPWIRWYRDLVAKGIHSADVVLAPSKWMLDAIRTHYGNPARSAVVHNARSASLFSERARKENCALTVGRLWDPAKQVSLLMKRLHSIPVYVAGQIENPENLPGAHSLLQGSSSIRLLGTQSEEQLRACYAKCAIYVATSRYEPFGLAPLEAALSGCALVLNDIETFRELWDDAACYFQRNDSESLAAEIERLAADAKLRERYARYAFERASSNFRLDSMLDSYQHLYTSLVTQEAYA